MARHAQEATNGSRRVCKRPASSTRSAYVYAVLVDGVVRYVGKGRNGRMYSHLIEAKRSAARCAPNTSGLYPRMHRKLVEAVKAGSQVAESVIVSGLTDKAAYRLESRIIGEFHKHRAGQLWNTIDERFLDPRFLPDEWDDPEQPLYKLPRPLFATSADRKSLRQVPLWPDRLVWILPRMVRIKNGQKDLAAARFAIGDAHEQPFSHISDEPKRCRKLPANRSIVRKMKTRGESARRCLFP